MNIMRTIAAAIARHREQEAAALDAQISEVLWQAQVDPSLVPRIVRADRVNVGDAYVIPASMMPDGKARLIAHPLTHVNEAAAIAHMDQTEPPTGSDT